MITSISIVDALSRLAVRLRGVQARVAEFRRLSGGASLETWAFTLEVGSAREALILRRRAVALDINAGPAIDLLTEAALLQIVARHQVPVPGFVHWCDDTDGLGEAYVTRQVEGDTRGRRIVSDSRFDAVRPLLARQCGEILARIHATPPQGVRLQSEDARAVLDHYEHLYRAHDAHRPVLELAFAHLRTHAPSMPRAVLLHGDFRNGNLMVDASIGIAAVLDWELAHLGDPAEDLGWLCVNSWRFGHPEKPVGGFGDSDELLAGYRSVGGEPMTLKRLRYWQAVGSLKWAVMCMEMYRSWKEGMTTSVERPMIGRRVSEAEVDLLNLFEEGI